MSAYRLVVFHDGAKAPTESRSATRASEVLGLIEELLAKHPDCHRIRVEGAGGFLFAVDCKGQTVTD